MIGYDDAQAHNHPSVELREIFTGGLEVKRFLFVMLVAVMLLSGLPLVAAQDATPVSAIDFSSIEAEMNDCSFLNRSGADLITPDVGEIACGTITVPENWSMPAGRQLEIAFAVLISPSLNPQPDPIVYLSGGPGESALSGISGYATVFEELRRDRNIILFDQRGTHFSSPLQCSTYALDSYIEQQAEEAGTEADESSEVPFGPLPDADTLMAQARATVSEGVQRCFDELQQTGVDLSQYNSKASANDTVALMRALGVDRFNLYGISYGTRLALVIMRDHPESGVRSVVLDSVFPPEIRGFEQYPALAHEVVMQLFAACFRDDICNTAYPNLQERFERLIEQLRISPAIMSDGDTVTDQDIVEIIKLVGQKSELGSYIPLIIEQLEQGDTTAIEAVSSGSLFSDDTEEAATENEESTPEMLSTPAPGEDEADALMSAISQALTTAPISRRSDILFRIAMLGRGPHTKEALQQFVTESFPTDAEIAERTQILELLDSMSPMGIEQFFVIANGLDSLVDLQTLGTSNPVFHSVECNEEIPFEQFDVAVEVANQLEIPQIAYSEISTAAEQFAACEIWHSGIADPIEAEPVSSNLPVLIFAGSYDTATPPTWNKEAFTHLENATFVQFAATNHAVIAGESACASVIATSFFDDPAALPNLSCSDSARPVWILPDGSVTSPS